MPLPSIWDRIPKVVSFLVYHMAKMNSIRFSHKSHHLFLASVIYPMPESAKKRPLPNRTEGAYILTSTLDSPISSEFWNSDHVFSPLDSPFQVICDFFVSRNLRIISITFSGIVSQDSPLLERHDLFGGLTLSKKNGRFVVAKPLDSPFTKIFVVTPALPLRLHRKSRSREVMSSSDSPFCKFCCY